MKFITDCLYLLAIVLISPKIIYRILRHNRYRTGWSQRLGKISRRNPSKKCIWIHAVSVGEVNATKTLIAKLKDSLTDYEIVISSTTDTGLARAKAIYADRFSVFYFPFDLSFIMRRAFKNLQPDICLLMELEVWPNLTQIAAKENIPVIIVNGRLSDKSFPKYKLIKPLTKWMFAKVSLVLAQTQQYADRFIELGCPEQKVIVTSSLKYDTAEIAEKAPGTDQLSEQLNIGTDTLWVAGGTGPNEEKIILQTFEKLKKTEQLSDLRLAIVPRKPERFDEVAELIASSGFQSVRYSEIKANETKLTTCPDIILGDTMGDLRKFYSLAAIVFIGRTLTPMGGSDMMEPAALGKCTIFGPHTFNFRQTVQALLAGDGAIEVAGAEQLYQTTLKCLTDTEFAKQIARNGTEVIKQNQGATEKTVKAIIEISGRQNS
jgi:3-deoxy-D-manno-octulosonic-acid transferase